MFAYSYRSRSPGWLVHIGGMVSPQVHSLRASMRSGRRLVSLLPSRPSSFPPGHTASAPVRTLMRGWWPSCPSWRCATPSTCSCRPRGCSSSACPSWMTSGAHRPPGVPSLPPPSLVTRRKPLLPSHLSFHPPPPSHVPSLPSSPSTHTALPAPPHQVPRKRGVSGGR